ncbi:MAG TPA: hypothetical protein VG992_03955 [Candidatus Saccharimonadales bacterium]|nr:hypothetical protein [Candidatus Saccharimonadales bacterium]
MLPKNNQSAERLLTPKELLERRLWIAEQAGPANMQRALLNEFKQELTTGPIQPETESTFSQAGNVIDFAARQQQADAERLADIYRRIEAA